MLISKDKGTILQTMYNVQNDVVFEPSAVKTFWSQG